VCRSEERREASQEADSDYGGVWEPSQEQRREVVQGGGLRLGQPVFEIAPEVFSANRQYVSDAKKIEKDAPKILVQDK
jgi:hypothetical protein